MAELIAPIYEESRVSWPGLGVAEPDTPTLDGLRGGPYHAARVRRLLESLPIMGSRIPALIVACSACHAAVNADCRFIYPVRGL